MCKIRTRLLVGVVILLACCTCAFALDPSLDISQYAHTAWQIRDGFVKGPISSLAQTPDGYLWLGTEFGLFHFDGVRAVPLRLLPGQHLPSEFIMGLLVSSDGTLWIATREGLASWKEGKLTQYAETSGRAVAGLVEDHTKKVRFGLFSPGEVCELLGAHVTCQGKGALGIGAWPVNEDGRGNLWVLSPTGLWRWDPRPAQSYNLPEKGVSIDSITEDNGSYILGTNVGMRRLSGAVFTNYSPPGVNWPLRVSRFLRTREGRLWLGSTGRGLLQVRDGRTDWFSQTDGLSGDRIEAMYEDGEGSLWVATEGGLDRFRDIALPAITTKQGLSSPVVWSVWAAKDGGVWLASPDGVTRFGDGRFTIYRQPRFLEKGKLPSRGLAAASASGPIVQEVTNSGLPAAPESLFQDSKGNLWVATPVGLSVFENGRFTTVPGTPPGQHYDFAEDNAGNLWVANQENGLLRIRNKKLVEQVPWSKVGIDGARDSGFRLVADTKSGGLWIAPLYGGLIRYRNGQVEARYFESDASGRNRIWFLHGDDDGTVWASTDHGLSRIKDGQTTTLGTANGLPCAMAFWTVQDDEGTFWINMPPCGLVRIAKDEMTAWLADAKRNVKFDLYDVSDGMFSAFSGYGPVVSRGWDGKLWIANLATGVSLIDPRHLPRNGLPPGQSCARLRLTCAWNMSAPGSRALGCGAISC